MLFLLSGGLNPVWEKLKVYVFTDTIIQANSGLGLHFYSVMQTIREAGHIPFETFANRISGHKIIFFTSLVGYLFLLYRHKIMLLSLPLVGLGFLASVGGLRFTIYAVPILAIQEIIKPFEWTRVPQVPNYILGVFNLRGAVIPLIDLRTKFGLSTKKHNEDTRFIVMRHGDDVAGL